MITIDQLPQVLGHTVYDISHKKVGTAQHVYMDTQTGLPEWLTVRTGLFGTKETFVPLDRAELRGEEVIVPFSKEQIKNAPNLDVGVGEDLPAQDEALVYDYYGQQRGTSEPARQTGPTAGRATTDDAMTRSEERLRVGKETRETGRARLRKYVTVEEEQQTVPVRRERVTVEREPITEANRDQAMAGPDMTEAEHEVVLHEERPVVATEAVPVERVRLDTEEVTEEETVGGQVRKERIEAERTDVDQQR